MREKILSFFSFICDGIWDISPDSPISFIVYLGIITIICVFLIIYLAKKSKKTFQKPSDLKNKEITFADLLKIANSSKSSSADLLVALQLYNENFNVAQNKEKSIDFFRKVLNHKNRHKILFDYFHGNILPKNLQYKDELDRLEREALNKRKKLKV